jgi:hypothetical protein
MAMFRFKSRISKGLHRLGLVLAFIFIAGGLVITIGDGDSFDVAVSGLVVGVAIYVFCRVLGWIADGFARSES